VAVVGAGFVGLWTAYWLARESPGLRIHVVEAEIAGYGAAGRNAGFVSAGIAGEAHVYAKRRGAESVIRAERAFIDAIDVVGAVVAEEGIECGWHKGGSLRVATSPAQLARVAESLAGRRARGLGEADVRPLTAAEIRERVLIHGVLGGSYTPHCARVDPARLVRGLAVACERRGVAIAERSPALEVAPGRVRCGGGMLFAPVVVLATEAYTTRLPGERRRFLPIVSHALATEPLPAAVWDEIGWANRETLADQRHLFRYAQRTPDDRILCGGAAASYRFGSAIRERDEVRGDVHARVEATLRAWFPCLAGAAITHRWGGPFAVPRDWSMSIAFDRATGFARAGGLAGHGVVGSSICGRTLTDLVLGRGSDLTALPWVDHVSPRWEPEPLRAAGARLIPALLRSADDVEDRGARRARRARLVRRFTPGR
jgi:glycine/D-amino acid oxidase-like deaminating enzyme